MGDVERFDLNNNRDDGASLALVVDEQVHQHDPLEAHDRVTTTLSGASAHQRGRGVAPPLRYTPVVYRFVNNV